MTWFDLQDNKKLFFQIGTQPFIGVISPEKYLMEYFAFSSINLSN